MTLKKNRKSFQDITASHSPKKVISIGLSCIVASLPLTSLQAINIGNTSCPTLTTSHCVGGSFEGTLKKFGSSTEAGSASLSEPVSTNIYTLTIGRMEDSPSILSLNLKDSALKVVEEGNPAGQSFGDPTKKTFTLNATNGSELYNSSNILNFKASTSNESRSVTLDKSILYAGANEEDSRNKNAVSVDYHGTNTITLDVSNGSVIYGNINNNWGKLNATIDNSKIVGNILYSIGSFHDKDASGTKGMLFSNNATLEGSIINQVYQNSNLTPIFTFENSHMKGNIINSVLNRPEFTNNVTVNFTGTSGKGSSFKGDIGAYSNHTTVNVDDSSSFSGSISGSAQANVVFTQGATIEITEVTNSNSASTIVLNTSSKASIILG